MITLSQQYVILFLPVFDYAKYLTGNNKLKISDILFTYVMGKSESFKSLKINSRDFTFCVEFPIKAKRQKSKYQTMPSFERTRIGGIKKVNAFKDGLLILIKMIKMFFIRWKEKLP